MLDVAQVALVPTGVLFASFKYGEHEGERNGRLFNSYTEASFGELCDRHAALRIVKIWRTLDSRPDHQGEEWLDVLLQKM